jgi:hypothetical protein
VRTNETGKSGIVSQTAVGGKISSAVLSFSQKGIAKGPVGGKSSVGLKLLHDNGQKDNKRESCQTLKGIVVTIHETVGVHYDDSVGRPNGVFVEMGHAGSGAEHVVRKLKEMVSEHEDEKQPETVVGPFFGLTPEVKHQQQVDHHIARVDGTLQQVDVFCLVLVWVRTGNEGHFREDEPLEGQDPGNHQRREGSGSNAT